MRFEFRRQRLLWVDSSLFGQNQERSNQRRKWSRPLKLSVRILEFLLWFHNFRSRGSLFVSHYSFIAPPSNTRLNFQLKLNLTSTKSCLYNVTASEELEVRISRLQERLERAEQVTKKWQAADERPKRAFKSLTAPSQSVGWKAFKKNWKKDDFRLSRNN